MSGAAKKAELPPDPQQQYRAALDAGRQTFQRCLGCGNVWLPPRAECPRCWSPEWAWEDASGAARVVSWVVYHTAFDKRFADRLPYNVALVELEEGPRMITNLVGIPEGEDIVGRKVSLIFEEDLGRLLPRYRLEE